MPLSVAVEDCYLDLPKMLLVLSIIKGHGIPKCSRTPVTRTLKGNEKQFELAGNSTSLSSSYRGFTV